MKRDLKKMILYVKITAGNVVMEVSLENTSFIKN